MDIEVTAHPRPEDEAFVIARTRAYNEGFVDRDVQPLCVFARDGDGEIVGGLTGRTYWGYLDIAYLWVAESHRRAGCATALMQAAEAEARRRGCRHVQLDTFSFQAPGFYERLGYREFGRLPDYAGEHVRHYLHKRLVDD